MRTMMLGRALITTSITSCLSTLDAGEKGPSTCMAGQQRACQDQQKHCNSPVWHM
jgi:hypothetical protein